MEQTAGVAWYWTLFGIAVFGAALYFFVKRIRDKGNGKFADMLRALWPQK